MFGATTIGVALIFGRMVAGDVVPIRTIEDKSEAHPAVHGDSACLACMPAWYRALEAPGCCSVLHSIAVLQIIFFLGHLNPDKYKVEPCSQAILSQ